MLQVESLRILACISCGLTSTVNSDGKAFGSLSHCYPRRTASGGRGIRPDSAVWPGLNNLPALIDGLPILLLAQDDFALAQPDPIQPASGMPTGARCSRLQIHKSCPPRGQVIRVLRKGRLCR